MNNKNVLLSIGAVVVLFALLLGAYYLTNSPAKPIQEMITVKKDDHVKWSPSKKHILVEYSDLECPACKIFHELLNSFEASSSPNIAITKNVTLVYRHFPLYQIHTKANASSYAAEAAGAQGKFFEMIDVIFADQSTLEKTIDVKAFLSAKASKIGLQKAPFVQSSKSQAVKDRVQRDVAEGDAAGINGTPTFFLDGIKMEYTSAQDFIDQLKQL